MGKFITGWFEDIGLDDRVPGDGRRRHLGQALQLRRRLLLRPGLRHVHLGLLGRRQTRATRCRGSPPDQIEWWNDPCWSNAEFDELADGAVQRDGQGGTPRHDPPDAGDHVLGDARDRARLPAVAAGRRTPTSGRAGRPFMDGGVWYVNYNIETLPEPQAQERRGGERLELEHADHRGRRGPSSSPRSSSGS